MNIKITQIIKLRRDGRSMWHVCETGDVHAGFWWGDLTERNHLEDLVVNGNIILKTGLH
jgi:hypothetical protein